MSSADEILAFVEKMGGEIKQWELVQEFGVGMTALSPPLEFLEDEEIISWSGATITLNKDALKKGKKKTKILT
jgi:hypothetical protein